MLSISLSRAGLCRRATQDHLRTVVKTVVYRIVMIAVTIIVAFAITGNTTDAVNIGILANIVKTGTYYAYERAWTHVTWGITTDT